MPGLLKDLELVAKLCKQRTLAERPGNKASLQLVCNVVSRRDLFLRLSGLSQELCTNQMTQMEHLNVQYEGNE